MVLHWGNFPMGNEGKEEGDSCGLPSDKEPWCKECFEDRYLGIYMKDPFKVIMQAPASDVLQDVHQGPVTGAAASAEASSSSSSACPGVKCSQCQAEFWPESKPPLPWFCGRCLDQFDCVVPNMSPDEQQALFPAPALLPWHAVLPAHAILSAHGKGRV